MRSVLSSTLVLTLLAAVACGPASDSVGEDGEVSEATQAAANAAEEEEKDAELFPSLPKGIKKAAKFAKMVMDFMGPVGTAVDIVVSAAELFGFLGSEPDPLQQLRTDLSTGLLATSWQSTLQFVDVSRSHSENAMAALRREALPFDESSPSGALLTSEATLATTQLGVSAGGPPNLDNSAFLRIHVDAATDGPWKHVIRDRPGTRRDPSDPQTLLVYDWRLGVPALMEAAAKRVATMAGSDPSFSKPANREELMRLRAALQGHHRRMTEGVKCNYRFVPDSPSWPTAEAPYLPPVVDFVPASRAPAFHVTYTAQIACADIYTGASLYEEFVWPDSDGPCTTCTTTQTREPHTTCTLDTACTEAIRAPAQQRVLDTLDSQRRLVINALPLFELKAMIDTLFSLQDGARDLTETNEEIPLEVASPSLCIEAANISRAESGVTLAACSFRLDQWWRYDRGSNTVANPASGGCLEVARFDGSDDPYPGAWAQLAPCLSPPPRRQQWSYDPETQVLQNGLNTVLDVQWGALSAGTRLWLWDVNYGDAQRWRAEQPFSRQAEPASGCGVLHPGEGLWEGDSVSSCDGRFHLALQADGDLVLREGEARIWDTGSSGLPVGELIMDPDGDLVLRNHMGGVVWHSNTGGRPGAFTLIQDDGNLVVYDASQAPVWASNTCCR